MQKILRKAWLLLVLLSATFNSPAQTFHSLAPLTSFGTSGTGALIVGDVPFITVGAIQRGLAQNPVNGNLIFVDRVVTAQSTNVSGSIYVLNGTNGSVVGTLATNGIQGGSFADYAVGVADDGVIYVGNVIVNTAAGPFKLYRWSNEAAGAPTVAFSGALGTNNLRWGNTVEVRGSGLNTQILVSSGGSDAAIFTTTDGVNFTANVLSSDATPGSLQGGLVFGNGNTYWSKFANLPLRLLSFDLVAKTATTIRTIGAPDMPEIVSHQIADVDNANHLLATLSPNGASQDQIFLYDIGNTNDFPQLLDSFTVTAINNANSGSPIGYVSFGGGKVYVHSLNNGIFAFNLNPGPIPAPTILTQPLPTRVLEGNTATFRVVAQRGFTFQWRKGNSPIPGATNSVLTIPNVQLSDATNYSVVVGNSNSSVTSSAASLGVLKLQDAYRLTPLWSVVPNSQPYFNLTGGVAATPNQRSFAYNSLSNHLYVVSRESSTSSNFTVSVINAETGGAPLYTLKTNGINFNAFAGGIGLVGIEVADDGSIYAANLDVLTTGTGTTSWKLYRWTDGGSNTLPQMVFSGDPLNSGSSFRWGDSMDLRGGGTNTQIIIDNMELSNPYVAILRPTDASLTNFTSQFFFLDNTNGGNAFAKSVQFASGDSFWQKRQGRPLVRSSFNLTNASFIAPVIETFSNFASTLGPVTLDSSRNLLGAINFTGVAGASPDQAELYDVTDLATPVLLSRENFPTNKVANTGNFGPVIFGGNKMFALEPQNGLVAFRVEFGAVAPPLLNIVRSGGNVVLTWVATGFLLESKTNLTSPTWDNVPFQAGSPNTATNAASETAKFYRLRK